MSASDKKKLRKEQTAAAMTEKQRNEKKKQNKQKAYTITFVVAMVLIVAIFVTSALKAPVKNLQIQMSTALTVNDHEIKGPEFNYFYVDAIRNFCSDFSSYGSYASMFMQMYGFNPAATVGSQVMDEKTGQTWADYFTTTAVASAKWTYTMYDEAIANDFVLTEEQEKSIADAEKAMRENATKGGISADKYVQNIYGSTASMDAYLKYYRLTAVSTAYASKYYEGLTFKDTELREHEKDKYFDYSSYFYAVYTVSVNEYLTGGTKVTGDDGKVTTVYSDEEKEAAAKLALADAKLLTENKNNSSVAELNKAIEKLNKTTKSCTEYDGILKTNLSISNEEMKKWILDEKREAGELTYFTNTTKTDDKETTSSYTVVLYLGRNDNTTFSGNVLHLLVKFTSNNSSSSSEFTDAEKAKAKATAELLLKEYENGPKTKEAFIELLKKHTDDVDSEGKPNNDGLYENVTPGSGYEKAFAKWAYDEHKPGDVGLVETSYGWHLMYYVGDGEDTYRDMLIEVDMKNEAYEKWEKALTDAAKVVESKRIVINDDFIVPTSFYTSYSY